LSCTDSVSFTCGARRCMIRQLLSAEAVTGQLVMITPVAHGMSAG